MGRHISGIAQQTAAGSLCRHCRSRRNCRYRTGDVIIVRVFDFIFVDVTKIIFRESVGLCYRLRNPCFCVFTGGFQEFRPILGIVDSHNVIPDIRNHLRRTIVIIRVFSRIGGIHRLRIINLNLNRVNRFILLPGLSIFLSRLIRNHNGNIQIANVGNQDVSIFLGQGTGQPLIALSIGFRVFFVGHFGNIQHGIFGKFFTRIK